MSHSEVHNDLSVTVSRVGDEILILDHKTRDVLRVVSGARSGTSKIDDHDSLGKARVAATLSRRGLLAGAGSAGLLVTVASLPQPAYASSPVSQFVPLAERELTESPNTLSQIPTRFAVIA